MLKKYGKILIFIFIFFIGLIILLNSINLANKEISSLLNFNGGILDSDVHLIYLEQSIIKFRYIGTILSLVGSLGILFNKSSIK